MEWLAEGLTDMNTLAVLVAALAGFGLGYYWYSDRLFGKQWRELTNYEARAAGPGSAKMGATLGAMAVTMLLNAFLLAGIIAGSPADGALEGMAIGALVGLFFVASNNFMNNLYQLLPARLTAIDGGYAVMRLALMGFIIGLPS